MMQFLCPLLYRCGTRNCLGAVTMTKEGVFLGITIPLYVVVVGTYELSIRKTSYNKLLGFNCSRPADYILANYFTNNNKHINNYTERDIHIFPSSNGGPLQRTCLVSLSPQANDISRLRAV